MCISQPRERDTNRIRRSHRADEMDNWSMGRLRQLEFPEENVFLRKKLTRERVSGHGVPSESLVKYQVMHVSGEMPQAWPKNHSLGKKGYRGAVNITTRTTPTQSWEMLGL